MFNGDRWWLDSFVGFSLVTFFVFVYGPKWLFPWMLERRQVHSHNRAKTKKSKTCLMVTKAHTSVDKVRKNTWCPIRLYLKKPSFHTILITSTIYTIILSTKSKWQSVRIGDWWWFKSVVSILNVKEDNLKNFKEKLFSPQYFDGDKSTYIPELKLKCQSSCIGDWGLPLLAWKFLAPDPQINSP